MEYKSKENKLYICSSCKQYKESNEFSKSTQNKTRDCLNHVCKECYSTIYKRNRIANAIANELDSTLKARFNDAKQRARKHNIYNDLVIGDLYELWNKQNGKCALSGIDMTTNSYVGRVSTNISIDKIDPTKGYTKSNIQLVCSATNMMKGSLTMNEFIFFCKSILEQHNNK